MAIKKKKSIKAPSAKAVSKSSAKNGKKVKKATVKKTVKKITKKTTSTVSVPKTKKIVSATKVSASKSASASKSKKATVKKTVSATRLNSVKSNSAAKIKKSAPKKVVAAKKNSPKKVAVSKNKKTISAVINKAKKIVVKNIPSKNTITATKKTPLVVNSKIETKAKVQPVQKTDIATSTEKFVKIGVKTKKQLVVVPPQPVIEVSNFPKLKVKTILISQPKPENDKNPYYELAKKYNLIETFRQFIKIEGIPVKDFRAQRIDILEHKAVILTSRMAVDHYFRMCNEMRITVPESMKYFCINEATAYYLQKYIQYRKRKIFFGHQTIQDLVDVIRKNREEKFLLPAADVHKEQICDFLDAINIKYTKAVMYRTVSADLSDIKNLNDFDVLAFFTPAGINSLKHNFPNFKQGNTRIACFGAATANTLIKHGYRLDIYAPNPKNPSMSGALDEYIKEANKR
jgi:uroporphyrinogen-III synthase